MTTMARSWRSAWTPGRINAMATPIGVVWRRSMPTPTSSARLGRRSRRRRRRSRPTIVSCGTRQADEGHVPATEPASTPRFDAFISYAHGDAADMAAALEHGLERLARPWNRRRALNVYRDRSSLTASADLSESLRRTMLRSCRLLLLASPGAASSSWVAEEVGFWLSSRSADEVLIAVVAGDLQWSPADSDFDWSTTTCLPAVLAGAFSSEPKYADLRSLVDQDRWELDDPSFRDVVAELSGALSGRNKDDLVGEDLRQFRKGRRIRRIGVGLLVVLTIASLAASVLAVVQQRRSEARAREVLAERLADISVTDAGSQPLDAILRALVSVNVRRTSAGHHALLRALSTATTMPEAIGSQSGGAPQFSPTGDLLLSTGRTRIQLLDPDRGVVLGEREVTPEYESLGDGEAWCAVEDATFAGGGGQVVTVDQCGRLTTWSVPDLDQLQSFELPQGRVYTGRVAAVPGVDLVAWVINGQYISVHSIDDVASPNYVGSPIAAPNTVTAIAALSDATLVIGGSDGSIIGLEFGGRAPIRIASPHQARIVRLRPSGGGANLFTSVDEGGMATVWETSPDEADIWIAVRARHWGAPLRGRRCRLRSQRHRLVDGDD